MHHSAHARALIAAAMLATAALIGVAATAQRAAPRSTWLLVYDGDARFRYTPSDLRTILEGGTVTGGCPAPGPFTGMVVLALEDRASRHWFVDWMPASRRDGVASAHDWLQYVKWLSGPSGTLEHLEAAMTTSWPNSRLAVAIMLPGNAVFRVNTWEATRTYGAYLDSARALLDSARFTHLSLVGYYWLDESVRAQDAALVRLVADAVHRRGARLLWVPFWKAENAGSWRRLGFDEAWQQPNYFFHPSVTRGRLDSAAAFAAAQDMGLEVEFDRRLFTDSAFQRRLDPYLDILQEHPTTAVAVYDGAGALVKLLTSSESRERLMASQLIRLLCSR